ncbi:MAG TPA: hypothetical protein VFQ73_18155 [Flavisolibacter sp.]|nr:hypothetical protein [Flavisolibacter sp.]
MKKFLASLILIACFSQDSWSQDSLIRPRAIGVSFFFNDFLTARRIRSTSLSQVLSNDQWAKFREMAPGVAVTYFDGLTPHTDLAASIAFSFPTIDLPAKSNSTTDAMLIEVDASVNLKMFTDSYWFTPYIIAGVGASKYKGYYGAFIPLGGGIKVNFFDEASLFITSQYRVPVTTETNNYHFMTSIGISGVIGGKK